MNFENIYIYGFYFTKVTVLLRRQQDLTFYSQTQKMMTVLPMLDRWHNHLPPDLTMTIHSYRTFHWYRSTCCYNSAVKLKAWKILVVRESLL